MAYETSAQVFFSVPSFVVSARLARDGEQVQVALASIRRRHFNALVASSSLVVFSWLTGAIPAGQGYYQPYISFLFFTAFLIGLHLAYCDWQTSRHFNARRRDYLRRLEDYQRWRDLPRWDETRRFSRWHLYSQRMRQEERENRRQVTIHWISQREEHIAPQAFYQRERRLELSLRGFNLAMSRPADYVSVTLQRRPHPIPPWGLRATNAMNRLFPRNRPVLVPRGNPPSRQGVSRFLPPVVDSPPRTGTPGRRRAVVRDTQAPPSQSSDSSTQQESVDTRNQEIVVQPPQPRRNPPRAARPRNSNRRQVDTAQPPQPRRNPPRAARPR